MNAKYLRATPYIHDASHVVRSIPVKSSVISLSRSIAN